MRFVAIFHDAVDPAKVDPDINQNHFDYLRDNSATIVLAGGLRDDAQAPFCGALWIIEASSKAEAVKLVAQDPFTREGIWSRYSVFAWGKAPFYGDVRL